MTTQEFDLSATRNSVNATASVAYATLALANIEMGDTEEARGCMRRAAELARKATSQAEADLDHATILAERGFS